VAKKKTDLAASYRKGASIRTLAARTGLSYGTVHNRLTDANVKLRGRGGPNHRKH
jgi:DNA-directed RNA polymerase specialized sigma24 family protein